MPLYSKLANPSATRAALERHGLFAKHRLGQNFLVDDAVVAGILRLAELSADDVVLEVGPGIGTLTQALLSTGAQVVAVEADRSLAPVLEESCAGAGERLSIIWGDALKLVPEGLPASPTRFVSNLPYQVAASLIMRVAQELPGVQRAVVMVQAEVADRICASAATKAYGAYSAKLALYARPTGRFEVGRQSFMPQPHVDSSVVRLDRQPWVGAPASTPQVIDAAFAQRRKTIRNSMAANSYDKEALDAAFAACGINPGCRAETLGVRDFVRLARALER